MAKQTGGNRIDAALKDQPPGLWPFIPAGYPDLKTTKALLTALDGLPIRGVELGFPFSDPIADGPVIQEAFTETLQSGIRVDDIFRMIESVRPRLRHPLLAMVSASIVYRMVTSAFVEKASRSGFDGLIIPDIPLEEAAILSEQAQSAGMCLVLLVAPTTPSQRQASVAALASGFLYFVSVQGVTGARDKLPNELAGQIRTLKASTELPVLVGFGISQPAHVREVCSFADGAIVGSAIVRRMLTAHKAGQFGDAFVHDVAGFIAELAGV